jgi:hypothetical protein
MCNRVNQSKESTNNEIGCTNIIDLFIIDVFTIKSLKKICKVVWNYYNNVMIKEKMQMTIEIEHKSTKK